MKPIIAVLCSAVSLTAAATDGYVRVADKGVCVGVTPDGSKIYGYEGRSGDESQITWIFDTEAQTTLPYCDTADSETGGQLMWLTDTGIGVGTYRDPQWTTTISDGLGGSIEDYPLNTACVWIDGSLISLDHNKWEDPSTFVGQDGTLPNGGNGFYAMKMTEDASTIIGYLKAFSYMLPVRWDLQPDGTYQSTMMHREVGTFYFTWVGASADCRRVVLNSSQSGGLSYIYDGDDAPWIFRYTESGAMIIDPHLKALSPNGRYAIMCCERNGVTTHGVYDFDTKSVRWIPLPEGAASSNWFAANVVTDRGDGFICDYNYQLHYFNIDLGINIPFKSYLETYGTDMAAQAQSISPKSLVRMVSGDGRTICGNDIKYSLEYDGWIVRLPDIEPILFALHDCQAMYISTDRALVKWSEPELPAGASVKHYIASVDGDDNIIAEPAKGDDGMLRAEVPCGPGEHEIILYCVATDSYGKDWESAHQTLELNISDSTGLYFFEDLCDAVVDETVMAYRYSHDTFYATKSNDSAVLNFRLDAGDFYDLTPFWYTCGFSNAEWHTYLESRWLDATGESDGFYFTWHERNMPINSATATDASNRLLLEYTTDGEHWMSAHESDGESNAGKWCVQTVDLSDLAGQQFRLRFHAMGTGKVACEWRVDYYGVMPASVMYDAPAGLMITDESEEGVRLAWKNNRGEYEVSYNCNSPMTYNTNVGNGGEPLYVACDYGPDKLKAFEGKYITAVSTLLYEPEDIGQAAHTKVQAVIFDSAGNELSRGTLADDAPWYESGVSTGMPIHHIDLDRPVQVKASETYRVSILITDYDDDMCPVWYYSASDDYLPGITDLYSDDNLKSWNTISDLFNDSSEEDFKLYGRCIFNIRPCISDIPEASPVPYCQNQWFYHVYRDGEQLPGGIAYYTQQSALDAHVGEATYTVRSFRRDGTVSKTSEPLYYVPSGIADVTVDTPRPVLTVDGGYLYVTGDIDTVAIYDTLGMRVTMSRVVSLDSLTPGVYVVVVTKDGKSQSVKWIR